MRDGLDLTDYEHAQRAKVNCHMRRFIPCRHGALNPWTGVKVVAENQTQAPAKSSYMLLRRQRF